MDKVKYNPDKVHKFKVGTWAKVACMSDRYNPPSFKEVLGHKCKIVKGNHNIYSLTDIVEVVWGPPCIENGYSIKQYFGNLIYAELLIPSYNLAGVSLTEFLCKSEPTIFVDKKEL